MTDDTIHVEEELNEAAGKAESTARRWTEEISVRGGEVKGAVERLAKEAAVRKITLKSQSGRTLAEIPLALGAAGVLIIGPWTAALLVAAWLTRVSILIEYEEAPVEAADMVEKGADELQAAAA